MTVEIPTSYVDSGGYTRSITLDVKGVPRDQWGRPVLRKRDGTWAGHTRISSVAKELDKGEGIKRWSNAMTVIGVAIDSRIRRRAEEIAAFSDNPYAEHKTELIRLADQAQEAAGSTIKRDLGTTLHDWAEIVDRTGDPTLVPLQYARDIAAYQDTLLDNGLTVLASEVFVVVDELEAAGSLDKLIRASTGWVGVGDVKTGQDQDKYPMDPEMQVAAYAHGDVYDLETHERRPLMADRTEGVLIHLPSGSGRCTLYSLDLRRGWQNLMAAADLKLARKVSNRKLPYFRKAS